MATQTGSLRQSASTSQLALSQHQPLIVETDKKGTKLPQSRKRARRYSDSELYPYVAAQKSKDSKTERPERKDITVRTVTTEEATLWMLGNKQGQFVSLLNKNDFFTLTGSNANKAKVIYMSREPHLAAPHPCIKEGDIALSQNSPFKNRESLTLAPCPEKYKPVSSAVIYVENTQLLDRNAIAIIGEKELDFIKSSFEGVPLDSRRKYTLTLPFSRSTNSEKESKEVSNSSMDTQGLRTSHNLDTVRNYTRSKTWIHDPISSRTRSKNREHKQDYVELVPNSKRLKVDRQLVRKPCMDTPKVWCQVTVKISPAGNDIPVGPFQINENTNVIERTAGQLICKEQKGFDISEYLENLKFDGWPEYDGDNYVHLNPQLYRPLNYISKQKHKDYFLFCKIGGCHYFCIPSNHRDIYRDTLDINQLLVPTKNDVSITLCDDITLQDAATCVVELKWLKQPFSINLSQQEIKDKTAIALKQVPLEKGRKIIIPLFLDGKTHVSIQGEIIEVKGEQRSESDREMSFSQPLKLAEMTDLKLEAKDKILLQGGEWQVDKKEQALARLTQGLAGMDDIACSIYDSIILPLEAFNNGQVSELERGLLLYGPPGTGKTILAKNLMDLLQKEPYLCDQVEVGHDYLTDSPEGTEKKIRSLESKARDMEGKVLVVFIDEIDSLIMGKNQDSPIGPVKMAFKTELQKLMSGVVKNILFIATTNKDKYEFGGSFTRSGRFGVAIHVDKPDPKQREEILKSEFDKSGYNYTALNLRELVIKTGDMTGSDFPMLVRKITMKAAAIRKVEPGGSLQPVDVESALSNPMQSKVKLKQVLNKISDKNREQCLLESEKIALQKVEIAINRVRRNIGLHTVVQVKIKKTRAEAFCHQLLQKAGAPSPPSVTSGQQLPPFNDFAIVHRDSNMLNNSLFEIVAVEKGSKAIVVINGIDKMIATAEGNILAKNTLHKVGDEWGTIAGSNSNSVALVLVDSGDEYSGRVNTIKEKLNLSRIDKVVQVTSLAEKKDYEKVLDEYGVKGTDKKTILNTIELEQMDIGQLYDLLDLYVQKGGDANDSVCDIDNLILNIRTNSQDETSQMFM